jgi:hypothetical protein
MFHFYCFAAWQLIAGDDKVTVLPNFGESVYSEQLIYVNGEAVDSSNQQFTKYVTPLHATKHLYINII